MRNVLKAALAATAILTTQQGLAADTGGAPLIERTKLFGNPVKANGRISPDGKWLSWTAPRDGVLNLWVAPVANPDAARPMTNERERPIRQYFWSPDSRRVLFIQDKGGDENFLLYGVDVATGKQVTLTPFKKTRAEIVGASNVHKDRILVGLNNRDRQVARRLQPQPRHREADPRPAQRRLCRLPRRQRPQAAHGAQVARRRRDRLLPDHQRQDRGQALRHRGARGFADHQPRRLHRRRQDPLLDRQPRPEHRRAHRPGRRDRQHDGARREPQSGHQRHAPKSRRRCRSRPIAPNI